MDPVLQRLGDVTIQRLEKPKEPKMGPQSLAMEKPKENKDEMHSSFDEDSGDDMPIPGLKRPFMPTNEISMKKFKFGPGDLMLGKKPDDLSEPEMSDYDSESELDYSEDEPPEMAMNKALINKKPMMPNKDFMASHSQLPSQIPSVSDDEVSDESNFLEKLVQQSAPEELPPPMPPTPIVSSSSTISEPSTSVKQEPGTEEDYDIDIKEKLKEMGEISFETVKKGEKPKKTEVAVENEVVVTTKKLGVDIEEIPGLPKGIALRRNIREVMDETKLDESTLAAQRQEVERLRRVQEQQRLLRELQRQAAQERMQNRVISMLQGNQFTKPGTSNQTRIGNTVLVKLPNGQTKPMTRIPKRPFELLRVPKNSSQQPMSAPRSRSLVTAKKIPSGPDLTPSVSIAPVAKKMMPPMMHRHSDSDSESDERKIMSPPLAHKPKAKPPVQTIDISSDDDCIVVSEPEEEEEETDHDDPTNSGLHTNDQFNQPDEQGRVLVNVGHPEGEPDVFVAPQISRIIKPHQIGGVRFLYDNVVESTSRFESSSGFGCILAHSMGLGKTLQIVTFCDIFLRHTSAKTILCIMPINTLQNWMAEFNMWIPLEDNAPNSPLAAHGEVRPRFFNILVLNDSHKTLVARAKVIHEWRSKGGVLLIGYEQFRLLSQRKMPKSRRKINPEIDDDRNSKLFDDVHTALVKPGPDLVICDEGHRIKNSHASISQALKQMETKRRVVLTGYPLQNNLMEYWCMVDFVRPNYLGSKTEFCNMFERPIMNGQCIDSTEADIKLMRYRAHVLHSLLLGFVQRRSHLVLQTALPQKEEYVLLVRMTPFQRTLYETFMNEVVRIQAVPNPLKAFAVCCKIWNHPDVLYNFLKKRAGCADAVDIDLEEVGGAPITKATPNEKPPPKSKRKAPAKGKNGKPAASVTPYNSTSEGAVPPVSTVASSFPTSTAPITSFSNALAQQQGKPKIQQSTSSQEESTTIQDISNNFPDTILQPYYDQEFDQNAQFPSSFPNSNNYSYPSGSNSNSEYNSGFNLSEQTQKTSFLNLDTHNSTPTALTGLSSEISLTPLTSKTKELTLNSGGSTLTTLTNVTNSINTTSALTPLKNACNMLNSVGSIADSGNSSLQTGSDDIMEIGGRETKTHSAYNQNQEHGEYTPNLEINSNFQNDYNYQQNFGSWNQPPPHENYDQQHSDYFGPPNNQFNPHMASSPNSWIKKEEPISLTPIPKSENSVDIKPKINIISDIKLPSVFNTAPAEKKINIISDIKIEPKTEGYDKYDVKPNSLHSFPLLPSIKSEFNNEIKTEVKTEFKTEPKTEIKSEEEIKEEKLPPPVQENPFAKLNPAAFKDSKEDSGIPYDWAIELLKEYTPGCIENSAKMGILFCIIRESIALGDRLLVFSQSLITLDLIEQFLQMSQVPGETFNWAKNSSYYRLDGSTSALEREKLINEFNSNPKIHLFLVSTRAGSLGINLVGANRVVVLDASWNPCHDTQAVCRVYRYGQRKPCFVYRLVVDNCLEKKIYDRQINKQGMSDRVVDECNPDAHLTMKDVSTLCWDDKTDEGEVKDWSEVKDNYIDVVLQKVLQKHGKTLNKEPFQHESLLVDRKEKQLSQQEKRLAKKGYEREKQASRQPTYSLMGGARGHRPVASVRPMQQGERPSRWIPAEHWQRQGMTAQEMTLPLDVVIPTNQPEKGNIVLKAGQKVLVLKSPKGVYMQLESGKIVAIKTATKFKGKADDIADTSKVSKPPLLPLGIKGNPSLSVVPQKRPPVKPFSPSTAKFGGVPSVKQSVPNLVSRMRATNKKLPMGKARPPHIGNELAKSMAISKDDGFPMGSGDDEPKEPPMMHHHHLERNKRLPIPHPPHPVHPPHPQENSDDDIEKRISLLKRNISIQRVGSKQPPQPVQQPAPPPPVQPPPPPVVDEEEEREESSPDNSAVEQMDHSNSSLLGDSTPFQDTLDSITSAYQATNDDNLESYEDDEISEHSDHKHHEQSEISDHSDDVTYVSDQSPNSQYHPQTSTSQQAAPAATDPPKTEGQEYGNYNNYYNYQAPPYHAPPPPQGYAYPQPPPQPYDMMYPPQPQQHQYNYGYQGYPPPPQPHYPPHPPPPQPGYDYSGQAPPAQPMYAGYQPYPAQYPPPPPPQGMYPPPPAGTPAAPPYSDYQQYAPPINNVAPPPAQYYPNS